MMMKPEPEFGRFPANPDFLAEVATGLACMVRAYDLVATWT